MRARILALLLGLIGPGLLLVGSQPAASQDPPPPPPDQPAATADAEALARGPVHEAYAEPVNYRPEPGPIVKKAPPDPVDEQPPDQKPDGADVRWIPGYWAWDDEGQDYLWVSGFWRDVPPGQRWVPGAWQEVEGGWQWSPGFWASDQTDQVNYVPTPPPSIDAGPSVPAAQESDIYVPGCWVWRERRFLWRPGFWVEYRPDWVWVPAHYVWSPGGCVFVDGFWDHPLERRGLLFAPVHFGRRLAADFVYTPLYVVRSDFLLTALFVGPARHNYYFGDFFTDRYQQRGFVAWVDYHPTRRGYDPLFSHYRAEFRQAPAWERNLHELYRARYSGDIPRPPHTFVQQEKVVQNFTTNRTTNVNVVKNINITNVQNVSVLAPVSQVHNVTVTNLAALAPGAKAPPAHTIKVQQLNKEEVTRAKAHAQEVRQIAQKRREHETKLVTEGTTAHHATPGQPPKAPPALPLTKPAARPEPPRTTVKPPPPPVAPRHEERPLPPHEPPKPPQPPRPSAKPPAPPPNPARPPEPPKKEAPPPKPEPPKKPTPPPAPSRNERPPEPPKRENPPPPPTKPPEPPRHEAPPPQHVAPPPPQHTAPPPPPPRKEPPPPPPKKEPPPPSKPPAR